MHDLDSILREVLAEHFDTMPEVKISWAPDEHMRDGADEFWAWWWKTDDGHFIGLNRALRRAPRWVVRYFVFHELLHVALPPRGRVAHHKAFRIAERVYRDTVRARAWDRARATRS